LSIFFKKFLIFNFVTRGRGTFKVILKPLIESEFKEKVLKEALVTVSSPTGPVTKIDLKKLKEGIAHLVDHIPLSSGLDKFYRGYLDSTDQKITTPPIFGTHALMALYAEGYILAMTYDQWKGLPPTTP
jgi:hypothetical protein